MILTVAAYVSYLEFAAHENVQLMAVLALERSSAVVMVHVMVDSGPLS